MHIGGKEAQNCPLIFVNGKPINESENKKYLGDYLTKYANPKATIQDRQQKGNGMFSNIRAILEDIPLGKRRLEIGITLREAWFINGTLENSEVWCSYSENNLKALCVLDRKMLKLVLNSHSKAPSEMLYLETGCLPLSQVITVRRLMYLHTILQRPETEIVRKVFTEQRNNPCKGDWVTLVEADLKELGMDFELIGRCSEDVFRQQISKKIRDKAFIELQQIQKGHEKVKYILFTDLSGPQIICPTLYLQTN